MTTDPSTVDSTRLRRRSHHESRFLTLKNADMPKMQ
jgi:hypothetical protein